MFYKRLFSFILISILALQVFSFPFLGKKQKLVIKSVKDESFKEYGRIVEGYSVKEILKVLKESPLPEEKKDVVIYTPEYPKLMALEETKQLGKSLYGGMPYQFGFCNGYNTRMNCLEHHRDSEFNLGVEDFILLLAKVSDVKNGKIDSSKVKAFKVPKGVLIEVYGSTLHYAPCHTDPKKGFHVLVALPKGTNLEKPKITNKNFDDKILFAANKWLYAHKDAPETEKGAYVGITGGNIDIAGLI